MPADKAAQNVFVVCRKYYLQVVLKEIGTTATYESTQEESQSIVDEHIKYFSTHYITKYGSTLYTGMDEVLAHYAFTYENSNLHFDFP